MSNGIGLEFYTEYKKDIYPGDHVVLNGYETKPPRYYDTLYEAEEPADMENIKFERVQQMQKYKSDNTPARLRDKEKVKLAQIKNLQREI